MALYTWSLFPSDLGEFLVDQGIDTAKANAAIRWASGEINVLLRSWDITASTVTSDSFPEDFEYLRGLATIGAAIYYKWSTSGSEVGTEFWQSHWGNAMQLLQKNPARLEVFSASEGGPVVQSHTTNESQSTIDDVLVRMTDQTNFSQWRTI